MNDELCSKICVRMMVMQLADDRAVRDSERKAAIMHFSTEQATQFTEHTKILEPEEVKQTHPRIEHVKSLSKPFHGKHKKLATINVIN